MVNKLQQNSEEQARNRLFASITHCIILVSTK